MEIYIQQVDIKKNCPKFYTDKFIREPEQKKAYITWKEFDPRFDVEYSWVKTLGQPLRTKYPENIVEPYERARQNLLAHYRAFKKSKIDLTNNCFYDLVPSPLLEGLVAARNKLSEYVWNNTEISEALYQTLKRAHRLALHSGEYRLLFDYDWISSNSFSKKVRDFKLLTGKNQVFYNIFGTKTGRFTTKKTSFPILTISRDLRKAIIPRNDLFVVFDYNAAEARTMLGLLNQPQPQKDIHSYHADLISTTRDQAKKTFFSWLYDLKKTNDFFSTLYDREKLIKNYYNNSQITTPYGRSIEVSREKSINYLLQSTTNDLAIENFCKVANFLKDKKSLICFTIHDSLVLDFTSEDAEHLPAIKEILQKTKYGEMPCSMHLGKNLKELRSIE